MLITRTLSCFEFLILTRSMIPASVGTGSFPRLLQSPRKRRFASISIAQCKQTANEQLLVVVGGGAAGMYAAIRAKSLAPSLDVVVVEKGKPLSKVKISGGGRCNVTNGHCIDATSLAENYPRGNKELRGSFFNIHGPWDTMSWFSDHGVKLKMEDDGRVFPVTDCSSSIVDCLLYEAKKTGILVQTGKVVENVTRTAAGKFLLKVTRRTCDFVEDVEADYLLLATGSSKQGYSLAVHLGHSIVDPMPSLFTFRIEDDKLKELSGVSFSEVKAKLKVDSNKAISQFTQVGPMLITHWGLSGPVILRLSAWGARHLFQSNYKGILNVDFVPDIHAEDVKRILFEHKNQQPKFKLANSHPLQFQLVKRFWKYVLDHQGLDGDAAWTSISNNAINSIALLLKCFPFRISGKGQFKDEFVTSGGVPLSEVSLDTMESRIQSHLFFAGEILNVDGLTGGFNFQNAWSGGYIAGTAIAECASTTNPQMKAT